MKSVLIIDTCILCCWLTVPGKETCGSGNKQWDKAKVDDIISRALRDKATLVLPLATIIETGNHIAQAPELRYEKAQELAGLMTKAADNETPWAAFTDQSTLWDEGGLRKLAQKWPSLASSKLSIGDATIKDVADYYAKMGYPVEIVTADDNLKSYQPHTPALKPRRSR